MTARLRVLRKGTKKTYYAYFTGTVRLFFAFFEEKSEIREKTGDVKSRGQKPAAKNKKFFRKLRKTEKACGYVN